MAPRHSGPSWRRADELGSQREGPASVSFWETLKKRLVGDEDGETAPEPQPSRGAEDAPAEATGAAQGIAWSEREGLSGKTGTRHEQPGDSTGNKLSLIHI